MRTLLAIVCLALVVFVAFVADSYGHFTTSCRGDKCKRHVVRPHNERLERIHGCEMRGHVGNWWLDGLHDGGLQFSPDTWRRTGSRYRFAHHAPVLEQKYRAVVWASRIGWVWRSTAGWPRCG